jgi:Zn ribbon nucleic-acid-binding protein
MLDTFNLNCLSTVAIAEKLIQKIECSNCKTTDTPLWRRDQNNQYHCNACGLYQKQYNKPRPFSLKSGVIKRRCRKTTGKRQEPGELSNKELSMYPVAQFSLPSPRSLDGNDSVSLPNFQEFLKLYHQ